MSLSRPEDWSRSRAPITCVRWNGTVPAAALFGTDYTTYDFSSSFDLDKIFGLAGAPQLTINVANFTDATLRSYFQFENATFTQYKPGRQFLIGLRGTF